MRERHAGQELKNEFTWAGEMAQWLETLDSRPEILSSIPRNHMLHLYLMLSSGIETQHS